ncbi:alanine dehydrogenase, partial [Paenibacillus sepulcri]|nr:alanine dehydrogenase [Paenibacillus sepulcri]
NVTMPYVLEIADKGLASAVNGNPALAKGLNVTEGQVTCAPVARELGFPYVPYEKILLVNTK